MEKDVDFESHSSVEQARASSSSHELGKESISSLDSGDRKC